MNEFQHQIMEHCDKQMLSDEVGREAKYRYHEIKSFQCPDEMFWNWVFDGTPGFEDPVLDGLMRKMHELEESITNRASMATDK